MALRFRNVTSAPLRGIDAAAPDGAVIGVIGENGAGKGRLLRLAAGLERPAAGEVETSGSARYIGPAGPLDLAPAPVLLIDHAFALQDAFTRERAAMELHVLRRAGSTVLVASHEEELLRRVTDEIWWLRDGLLARRGDPAEVLASYRAHVAHRVRAWGETAAPALDPRVRRGDGRAEIEAVETLGENGRPTMVWSSGEPAVARVRVRFREAVAGPVVGIMIRNRVGLNVYGTNTELEGLKLGLCAAGESLEIDFGFRCNLCPEAYTLTAASHDPDGACHDWLEDAVAFLVTDTRYTAGVANLRAQASISRRA
jgi:ABC-type taurine transport system ATPase subunit